MTKFRDKVDGFTYAQVEGALCAWEYILDARNRSPYKDHFEGIGSCALRMVSMQVGDICDRLYNYLEKQGYECLECYDWEFVPRVCDMLDWDKLVNDNQFNGPVYDPPLAELAGQLLTSQPKLFSFEDPYTTWINAARVEARFRYAFPEMIDEDPEGFKSYFEMGLTYPEAVKRYAEKYDLLST